MHEGDFAVRYVGVHEGGLQVAALDRPAVVYHDRVEYLTQDPTTGDFLVDETAEFLSVDDDLGILLCEQVDNWVPANPHATKTLRAFYKWVAAMRGVDAPEHDEGSPLASLDSDGTEGTETAPRPRKATEKATKKEGSQ